MGDGLPYDGPRNADYDEMFVREADNDIDVSMKAFTSLQMLQMQQIQEGPASGAVVLTFKDSAGRVRDAALDTLGKTGLKALARHVVLKLEDDERVVRRAAFIQVVLHRLEPAVLAQHADAVVLRLEDSD